MTQYNIMSSSQGYNVTSSPLVRDSCLRSKCSFTQSVKTTGALYDVTVASINAVGVGPWSDPKQGRSELDYVKKAKLHVSLAMLYGIVSTKRDLTRAL